MTGLSDDSGVAAGAQAAAAAPLEKKFTPFSVDFLLSDVLPSSKKSRNVTDGNRSSPSPPLGSSDPSMESDSDAEEIDAEASYPASTSSVSPAPSPCSSTSPSPLTAHSHLGAFSPAEHAMMSTMGLGWNAWFNQQAAMSAGKFAVTSRTTLNGVSTDEQQTERILGVQKLT